MKIGLVLEGGGMRGFYTMGALDYLMEQELLFDYVIGVSAGACHGVSYVSNQHNRSYRINTNYLSDSRYISFRNFIKTKSLFGMDFIFNEIPHQLDLFDYETFLSSPCEFKLGVTDVKTGNPVYFDKLALHYDSTLLKASSSIPVFSPIVEYQGRQFLDGGTSDPIPIKKALEDGCDKVVVILTRDRQYQKEAEKFRFIYKRVFKNYPKMTELLDTRHQNYNQTLAYLKELETMGKALIIAPSDPITISRFEKKKENLEPIYEMGRLDLSKHLIEIKSLLKKA